MTAQQIANRVQQEADARFPEVVERLLFLLDLRSDPSRYVVKWEKCGILDSVPENDRGDAAFTLETTALILIDEQIKQGSPLDEDYVVNRLYGAVKPYQYDR